MSTDICSTNGSREGGSKDDDAVEDYNDDADDGTNDADDRVDDADDAYDDYDADVDVDVDADASDDHAADGGDDAQKQRPVASFQKETGTNMRRKPGRNTQQGGCREKVYRIWKVP